MNSATAKMVGKAMADIRAAIKGADDEDKAAIAASLRSLLEKAEGAAPAKAEPAKRREMPSAAEIDAAAKHMAREGKGWCGGVKVFISDVYEALNLKMSLREFKAALPAMQQSGAISMSRADLVEAMDPEKVAASEVLVMADFDPRIVASQWHFLRGE